MLFLGFSRSLVLFALCTAVVLLPVSGWGQEGSAPPFSSEALVDRAIATVEGPVEARGGSSHVLTVSRAVSREAASATISQDGHDISIEAEPATGTVVRETPDGVRLATVLPEGQSQAAYKLTLPAGSRVADRGDGGLVISDETGQGYASIERPWALDAVGKRLPTTYTVAEGQRVVQEVDTTGAVFPVVADPSISFGWFIYVKYSKEEVQWYWEPGMSKVKYAAALCAALTEMPVAAAACAFYVYDTEASLNDTFVTAKDNHQCVELKFTYGFALVGWKPYDC